MRFSGASQTVILTMPQTDLLLLCVVPEFRNLLARYPDKIKVQAVNEPCKLYINRMLVPMFLSTRSDFHGLARIRESLRRIPPTTRKM